MSDAVQALRGAIQARLQADAALTALIGPGRVYDEAPRAAAGVYVVHGDVEARDWSTSSDEGCEQTLSLVVWAAQSSSSKLALDAASLIVASLNDAPLTLAGHRLVALAWQTSRLVREPKTGLPSVTLRFRAVTEQL